MFFMEITIVKMCAEPDTARFERTDRELLAGALVKAQSGWSAKRKTRCHSRAVRSLFARNPITPQHVPVFRFALCALRLKRIWDNAEDDIYAELLTP